MPSNNSKTPVTSDASGNSDNKYSISEEKRALIEDHRALIAKRHSTVRFLKLMDCDLDTTKLPQTVADCISWWKGLTAKEKADIIREIL